MTEVDSPVVTPERRIRWEYRRGVREALLSLGGRRSRIRRTLADIAAEFAGYDPWFALLRRILDDSPVGELPELDETSLRLAADTCPRWRASASPTSTTASCTASKSRCWPTRGWAPRRLVRHSPGDRPYRASRPRIVRPARHNGL